METTSSGPAYGASKLNSNSNKKICRCCLTTDKLMKNSLEVQEYFMELSGINVTVSDGMPPWVCVECIALMKKGIGFKYKMLRAQSVLYDYLMKSPPGQLNPRDPELVRYRAPHLSATRTLTFSTLEQRDGFHAVLQQEKQVNKTDLYDVPLLPLFENPLAALETVEAAFSDFEDDPLERFESKKVVENENEDDEEEAEDENEVDDEEDLDDEELEDEEEDEEEEEEAEIESESDDDDDESSEPEVKKPRRSKKKDIKMERASTGERLSQPAPEMSWTSENDEILIDFVKHNEALYNPKSKTYKIGVLKKKLWIDIGAILNKSDTECCKRWNYVRDYYIRRRGKRATGGEAARRRAAQLAFLDAVPSTARSGWPPPAPRDPQPVKEEGPVTNFEHLWEQIRIGEQYSKMSPDAWCSAKEELLIDFVRRHEPLYNPRCKDFRKPQLKHKLWCDIGQLLNKSDTDCAKRWGYVRDYYTRRKSNPGALSTGKAAKRRAELLSFLDYVPPPQRAPPDPADSQMLKSERETQRPRVSLSSYARMGAAYSKMSSNATWSSDNDEVLIEFVKRNESLFNPKSKDFRKAHMKQRLWRTIGAMLKKTDSECYKRWCYVRDYYIRRRGKAGVLSTGKAARRRAQLLAFLDRVPSLAKSAPTTSHDSELKAECGEEAQEKPCAALEEYADFAGEHIDDYREQYSKLSSNVTWTWEDDERLIEFVRRNDALYNPKSRNSRLKQKLWSEIAATLDKTDIDCCKRWCYVRDYYRRRSKFAPCGESARRRATLLAFLDRVPSAVRSVPAPSGPLHVTAVPADYGS